MSVGSNSPLYKAALKTKLIRNTTMRITVLQRYVQIPIVIHKTNLFVHVKLRETQNSSYQL